MAYADGRQLTTDEITAAKDWMTGKQAWEISGTAAQLGLSPEQYAQVWGTDANTITSTGYGQNGGIINSAYQPYQDYTWNGSGWTQPGTASTAVPSATVTPTAQPVATATAVPAATASMNVGTPPVANPWGVSTQDAETATAIGNAYNSGNYQQAQALINKAGITDQQLKDTYGFTDDTLKSVYDKGPVSGWSSDTPGQLLDTYNAGDYSATQGLINSNKLDQKYFDQYGLTQGGFFGTDAAHGLTPYKAAGTGSTATATTATTPNGNSQVATVTPAQSPAAAQTPVSQAALTNWNVDPTTQTVQGQLNNILAADGRTLQAARGRGQQAANERGLLNSTLGMQMAEDAVVNAALDIARPDAATYANAGQYNAQAANQNAQFNAQESNQVGMFNAGQTNQVNMFNTAQDNTVSMFNASQSNEMQRFYDNLKENARQFDASLVQRAREFDTQFSQQASQFTQNLQLQTNQLSQQSKNQIIGYVNSLNSQLNQQVMSVFSNPEVDDATANMIVDNLYANANNVFQVLGAAYNMDVTQFMRQLTQA